LSPPSRVAGLPACGRGAAKPIETNFKNLKASDLIFKPPHIHTVLHNCKGKPNHVYARQKDVYYACINGKEVCSEEKATPIPSRLIGDYQACRRAQEERMEEGRARSRRVQEEIKAASAKGGQSAAGRREPVAGRGAPATASVTVVSTAPAASSPVPPPIADEQVRAIPAGIARAAVVQKLGEPYMKITGETECYTYRLQSGNTAGFEFEAGKLRQLQVVRPR
jgi:hypothetical protein